MARPEKNNAEYFSHDADMRNDDRIKAVRKKFKSTGYAIYNMLLEYLTDKNFFRCDYSDLSFELMAGDFDEDPTIIKSVIDYCLQLGLLQREEGFIRCKTLENRLEAVLLKRKRAKKEVSVTETTQSKVKESKVFVFIGEPKDEYVIVLSRFLHEKHKKIFDLPKHFEGTGQLDGLKFKGFVHFEAFMHQHTAKIFNDDMHLDNTFRNFSETYQPPARAPDAYKDAQWDRDNMTLQAWEELYSYKLNHDNDFRRHFGYKELSLSQSVGG